MMNFKLNQSNFIKCVIALKLTWPHIIGIDWPVLQSDMYLDQSAVAQGHFYLWIDYDKSEVKENAFHCLWWQETKLFEKMSLLNDLALPSSNLYHHQRQTKSGPILLVLKSLFLSPLQPFLNFSPWYSVVLTVTVLGRVRNSVTSTSQRHSYMLCEGRGRELSP